jgi:hypothetical protein
MSLIELNHYKIEGKRCTRDKQFIGYQSKKSKKIKIYVEIPCQGQNALAYFAGFVSDEEKNSLIALAPGANVIKLFSFIADDEAK